MKTKQLLAQLEAQQQVVEKVALGAELEECLTTSCVYFE